MSSRRLIIASSILAFVLGALWLSADADARGRRGRSHGKNRIKVVQLKRGERQVMPARNWVSVSTQKPGVVRAYLNKRLGRVTLVPKRRGRTIMEFKMSIPRHSNTIKGKMLLVVK